MSTPAVPDPAPSSANNDGQSAVGGRGRGRGAPRHFEGRGGNGGRSGGQRRRNRNRGGQQHSGFNPPHSSRFTGAEATLKHHVYDIACACTNTKCYKFTAS